MAECETFKKQIKVISDIVSEGRVKIDKDSLGVIAIDAANVAMIDYKVFSSACIQYLVDEVEEFAIDFNKLYQVIKTASTNAILKLTKEDNKLVVIIKAETERTFKLPFISCEGGNVEKAKLEHDVTIKVDSAIFKQEVNASNIIADSVSFVTKNDKFIMKADDNISEIIVKFNDIEVKTKKKGEILSKYNLGYLKKFIEACAFCDKVHITYKKDKPAKFRFKQVDKFKMDFIIAPRVDEQ